MTIYEAIDGESYREIAIEPVERIVYSGRIEFFEFYSDRWNKYMIKVRALGGKVCATCFDSCDYLGKNEFFTALSSYFKGKAELDFDDGERVVDYCLAKIADVTNVFSNMTYIGDFKNVEADEEEVETVVEKSYNVRVECPYCEKDYKWKFKQPEGSKIRMDCIYCEKVFFLSYKSKEQEK